MAKLKFGMVVTGASGKLGGHVFARNRGGAYARSKVTPVNPQTVYQQGARTTLSNFSQAWRGLTQAERDAWNAAVTDYARTDIFGDLRNPTGKNLYTLLNINLDLIGISPISSPLQPTAIGSYSITGVSIAVGTSQFDVSFVGSHNNQRVLIEATDPLSAGVSFFKNRFRVISDIAGNAGSPADFWADYTARFGVPPVGSRIAVRMTPVSSITGQKGVPVFSATVVQA